MSQVDVKSLMKSPIYSPTHNALPCFDPLSLSTHQTFLKLYFLCMLHVRYVTFIEKASYVEIGKYSRSLVPCQSFSKGYFVCTFSRKEMCYSSHVKSVEKE